MTSAERPWEPDRSFSADSARAAIRSQFPDIDLTRLGYLGSGWEFDVYLTTDGWVFRFPRRAEYSTAFESERSVQALVSPVLSPSVAVPETELLGAPGPDFPYSFAGHRIVPGVAADTALVPLAPRLGSEIGSALSAIHAIPEGAARAAGLQKIEEGSAEWLAEALAVAADLRGIAPPAERALAWLTGTKATPRPYPGPPRVVHNDLCPDHILVDSDSGRLVGFIDWTDAALGDPAFDFVALVLWRGWAFVDDVLGAYSAPLDPDFRARLSFFSRVGSLLWLHESRERGTDVAKHVAWVANAFADGDAP